MLWCVFAGFAGDSWAARGDPWVHWKEKEEEKQGNQEKYLEKQNAAFSTPVYLTFTCWQNFSVTYFLFFHFLKLILPLEIVQRLFRW